MVVVEVVDVGGSHLVESPFFLNYFSRGETSECEKFPVASLN